MKNKFYFFLGLLCIFNVELNYAQENKLAQNSKDESFVKFIDTYVNHINVSLNDSDDFDDAELNSIDSKKGFKHNSFDKQVIYKGNKIVKLKHKEYLDNNFIKLLAFYYQNNQLVYVKINELLPGKSKKGECAQRSFYFKNNKLLFESNKNEKYNEFSLLNLGKEKLQEEYQAKVDD